MAIVGVRGVGPLAFSTCPVRFYYVGNTGIEPVASSMSTKRSNH